ncbi:hypothetical protein LPJ75_005061, partial [Coemansia sp. RSA 2598]
MTRTTLSSIPWIRKLNNEVLGDIFYYFSTFHGQRLLSMVISKLNTAYDAFIQANPRFSGPISLVAHSLGGMICYEILYFMNQMDRLGNGMAGNVELERYRDLPKLKFIPDRLFTLGTPLGTTLVFRNLYIDRYHMGPVGYHNIFHPYDPFGYRMEPLHDEYYADVAAVPITVESPQVDQPPVGLKKVREKPSLADLLTSNSSLLSLKTKNRSVVDTSVTRGPGLPGHQRSRSFFASFLDKKFPKESAQTGSPVSSIKSSRSAGNPSDGTRSKMVSKLTLGFKSFRFGDQRPKRTLLSDCRNNLGGEWSVDSRCRALGGLGGSGDPRLLGPGDVEPEVENMVLDYDVPATSPLVASLFSLSSAPQSPVKDIDDIDDIEVIGCSTVDIHGDNSRMPQGGEPEDPVDPRYADIDDIFIDDVFGQLAQLFGNSNRLSLEQQMAQTQGLP